MTETPSGTGGTGSGAPVAAGIIAPHPQGPAGQILTTLQALGLLWQLRALDNIWTNLVATDPPDTTDPKQVDPEALAQLGILVDGIERTFQEFAAVSKQLEPVVVQHADALRRQPPDKLLENLSESSRVKVQDVLSKNTDLAEATRAALANMDATAASATANLRAEVDKLSKGGTSEGDYDPVTEGVIGVVAAGAGSLAGPLGAAGVEAFAHSSTGAQVVEAITDAISDAAHAVWDFFFG
jgi:hypothetical protein